MTTPDAARAGEPFRCCLCGQRNPRCLCRRCRLAHTDEAGVVAPWLLALKNEADRLTQRERRARGKLQPISLDMLRELAGELEEEYEFAS